MIKKQREDMPLCTPKTIDTCTKLRTTRTITKDRFLLQSIKLPQLNIEASKPRNTEIERGCTPLHAQDY